MKNDDKLMILGFLKRISLSDKRVSGTLSLLNEHLMARELVKDIIDVEIYGIREKINLIKNCSFSTDKWSFKNMMDVRIKEKRSIEAAKKVSKLKGTYNVCLQIGSEFKVHDIEMLKKIPRFSYHDNNLMALLKNSHYYHKYPKIIKRAFDFEKEVYDNLDGIFTMTEHLKQSFISDFKLHESKVHSIGFGPNLSYENIERDYDGETILFIAKDSFEKKGGKVLLEAFNKVKSVIKNSRLILVGQRLNINNEGVEVIDFIDKNREGGVEKLKSLYREASLFVMPSPYEATGNVFLEAMSNKVPCIGADIGATSEILIDNNCGIVVEPGNDRNLAHAIIDLLENKKLLESMGENGFKAIENKYNWDTVCTKAIHIMESYL